MKKTIPGYFFLFILAILLSQGAKGGLAGDTACISSGDYELVTQEKGDDEILYKLNNKTGQTWIFEGKEVGWVKLREQQT